MATSLVESSVTRLRQLVLKLSTKDIEHVRVQFLGIIRTLPSETPVVIDCEDVSSFDYEVVRVLVELQRDHRGDMECVNVRSECLDNIRAYSNGTIRIRESLKAS